MNVYVRGFTSVRGFGKNVCVLGFVSECLCLLRVYARDGCVQCIRVLGVCP